MTRPSSLLALAAALATLTCPMPDARVLAAPASAVYSHAESGFAVTAPTGWRHVREGEMQLPASAAAGFVVVEFIPGGLIASDDRR
jgi:hypothetical protein